MDLPSKVHLDCFPQDFEDDGSGPEELFNRSMVILYRKYMAVGEDGEDFQQELGVVRDGLRESDCAVYRALTVPTLLNMHTWHSVTGVTGLFLFLTDRGNVRCNCKRYLVNSFMKGVWCVCV